MSSKVHSTAIIDSSVKVGEGVEVGPYAIVGEGCVIGDGCVLSPHAVLERNVILGKNVKVGTGSVLGGDPQDLKFRGEITTVEIGDNSVIREYATINRGTSHSNRTSVGQGSFIMSYVHLAHDCQIGNGVIISNSAQLAGHVTVEDRAIISGMVAVHQFTRIGRHSFVGGCSRVSKDVPPFIKAVGNPMKLYGLNSVGLQRSGFEESVVRELKRAYRLFFRSGLNVSQAIEKANSELEPLTEVRELIQFLEASERGVAI